MDHSELGGPYNGFQFKFLEPSKYDEALQFLEDHLYAASKPIGYSKKHPEDWNDFFRAMMENGTNLSYIIEHIETGELAAVRMIDLNKKDKPEAAIEFKTKLNEDIFRLCYDISKVGNLFEKYGITEYPDMFGLAVHPKFRNRGLASESYNRGLAFLKKRGFKIAKCGFVSPFSRKAGMKHGYKEFARRYFHDCKDSESNTLNPSSDPNDFVCFGVFIL